MMRKLDKDKKVFLAIGLPIFIFLGGFFSTHYFQITAFFIVIFTFAALGLLRKKRFWLQLTKVGFFTFVFYLIMFNNVIHLPSQFARRMPGARQALIEPNHIKIIETKQNFLLWDDNRYTTNFTSLSDSNRTELEWKMARVDYYIHYVVFEYKFDTSAPYYYYDHLPTIDEIFVSDIDGDGKLQDDCDGITLVTCSLLLNMGYNAWIAEVEFHYHTMVFPAGIDPHTEEGFNQRISLYNSNNRAAYIMFNTEELIIPPTRPIYLSFFDVFYGDSLYDNYLVPFLTGDFFNLQAYIMIIIDYIALLIISIGLTIYVKAGEPLENLEKKDRHRKILKISFINSLICSAGLFAIYIFSLSGLGFLGTLILGGLFISVFRFTDFAIKKISR